MVPMLWMDILLVGLCFPVLFLPFKVGEDLDYDNSASMIDADLLN